MGDSNSQPLGYKASALAIELYSSKLFLGRSWVYPVGVLHHYIFIISKLWLTSHLRSTVSLLDTGTPGTSREICSEYADRETRTRNPSITNPVLQPLSYAAQSYCWEGVEFIQLVYCIIKHLSSLNCDWLLIWEVQSFYWAQELLVQVEKFPVRMQMGRLELATFGLQTQCSRHWAIQLKAIAGKEVEFIQSVYCIIIYLSFLNSDWPLIWEVQWLYWTQELLVPVEKFTVRMPMERLELATPGLHTQCSSHWAIQLKAIPVKELSLSSWCMASLYIYHI